MDEYSALSSDRLIDLALKGDPIERQVALCTIRGIVPRWTVRYRRPMDRQAQIMLKTLPPEWARHERCNTTFRWTAVRRLSVICLSSDNLLFRVADSAPPHPAQHFLTALFAFGASRGA